ncbi:MAG: hypothetical protein ACI89U_001968 [Gammaproteobacteria bacterium]|jgi:hypothetical protein
MPKRFLSKVHLPLIMLAIVLSGCDNKWENMPDDELAAKSTDCYGDSLSTAMIQVCKNYERECERRRSTGVYVC